MSHGSTLAFKTAEKLTREDKAEILVRAFQVNHERLMARWPRFVELYEWSRARGRRAGADNVYGARLAGSAGTVATGLDGRRVVGQGSGSQPAGESGQGFQRKR